MIDLVDTCYIAQTVSDGYGDVTIETLTQVACLFLQSTGNSHANNAEITSSDAHVYLDVDNEVLSGLGYRIEGMYLYINPFGATENSSWFKITRVSVGQRKLIDNEVDNVHAYLQKVSAPLSNVVS